MLADPLRPTPKAMTKEQWQLHLQVFELAVSA